ncbi:MAG TPA: cyclomaltodextrinase N-terminal domain-containing protein, partial [Flavobacteriales bacterium]
MDPPNWWLGMKHSQLEILFYGSDFHLYEITLESAHTYIEDIHAFPNTNYILVKIHIGEEQQPGTIKFRFQNKKNKKRTYYYHY